MSAATHYSLRKLKREYYRAIKQCWYWEETGFQAYGSTLQSARKWAQCCKNELERRGVWLP